MLTGAGLGLVVGIAVLFGRHRPDAEASLEAQLPAPQTWTRLSSARPPSEGAPLEAEFRAATIESPEAAEAGGTTSTVTLELPVAAGDCAALEARLGGGCGKVSQPLIQPERLAVESLGAPLQGVMRLRGSGAFELSQSGTGSTPQPTEWTLTGREPETTLEIACDPGDQLLLAGAAGSQTTTCSRFGPEYSLEATVERHHPPHLHLNGVHWIHSHLVGDAAETTVEEGRLILDQHEEPVSPSEPEKITIRGKAPHSVHLTVRDTRSGAPHVSVTTELATTAEGAGHELPTWVEAHSELSYLVIGAVAGIFLTAFFDYLVKRFLKTRRRR